MPFYSLRCTFMPSGGRKTPVIDSRTFEAATHSDALRIGRMISGFAKDDELRNMIITDDSGRIVWNLVPYANQAAQAAEQRDVAAQYETPKVAAE